VAEVSGFPNPGLALFFFRPLRGLVFSDVLTHGLRRGLYSCAASRLRWTVDFPGIRF